MASQYPQPTQYAYPPAGAGYGNPPPPQYQQPAGYPMQQNQQYPPQGYAPQPQQYPQGYPPQQQQFQTAPAPYPPQAAPQGYPQQGYPQTNYNYPPPQPVMNMPPQQQHFNAPAQASAPTGPTRAQMVMETELFGCFDDPCECCCSWIFPCIQSGRSLSRVGGSFLYGCCCFLLCGGCIRNDIQEAVGAQPSGCAANCVIRYCCLCCALTQESRATKSWIEAGNKPTPGPAAL